LWNAKTVRGKKIDVSEPLRILRNAVIVKPSSLLRFDAALETYKYQAFIPGSVGCQIRYGLTHLPVIAKMFQRYSFSLR
jgi:hypothetical protein